MTGENDKKTGDELKRVIDDTTGAIGDVLSGQDTGLGFHESGTVCFVGKGIARITGLPNVRSEELIRFPGGKLGIALNLEPDEVAVILLDKQAGIEAGQAVSRTGRVVDVPVGEGLLGRVVDAKGMPLDGGGAIPETARRPICLLYTSDAADDLTRVDLGGR